MQEKVYQISNCTVESNLIINKRILRYALIIDQSLKLYYIINVPVRLYLAEKSWNTLAIVGSKKSWNTLAIVGS